MTDDVPPETVALPRVALRRKRARTPKVNRARFIDRVWATAEKQLEDIEARLERLDQSPGERDDIARGLGVLVKTLRELAAFDAAKATQAPKARKKPNDDDIDPVPRDIDQFRRELARKMDDFVASRTGSGVSGGAAK